MDTFLEKLILDNLAFSIQSLSSQLIDNLYGFIVPFNLKGKCEIVFMDNDFNVLSIFSSGNFVFDVLFDSDYEFNMFNRGNPTKIDVKKRFLSQFLFWININYPGKSYKIYIIDDLILDKTFPTGIVNDIFNLRREEYYSLETSNIITNSILKEEMDELIKVSDNGMYEIDKYYNPKSYKRILEIKKGYINMCSKDDGYQNFTSLIIFGNNNDVFIQCHDKKLQEVVLDELNKKTGKVYKINNYHDMSTIPEKLHIARFFKSGQNVLFGGFLNRGDLMISNFYSDKLITRNHQSDFNKNFIKHLIGKCQDSTKIKKQLNKICSYDVIVIPYEIVNKVFSGICSKDDIELIVNDNKKDTYFKH